MRLILGLGLFLATAAWAASEMEVTLDRNEVGQDETVTLRFSFRVEGQMDLEGPNYDAPDFDLVNQYEGQFIESYLENGHFGMRNNRTVTRVLHPKKMGQLKVSGISAKVNGKKVTSPDLAVNVIAGGAGTPPPRGYGGGGMGLRGVQKRGPSTGFFLRAEINKQKLFKGEQLVVSYYLYRRARVFNIAVDRYPVLSGFLREDLEIPVLGQRLDVETVTMDGAVYQRSLLARYAAYPLKEGKLPIDPMSIKANYYGGNSDQDDEDPMTSFFQQMTPLVGTSQSDPVSVEVLPLPPGKPPSFTGGIGEFELSATVDKTQVRAGEAITLTVRVEGRGNTRAIEAPQANWPVHLQLFDSKGSTKESRAGSGEKVFEYILIPRATGPMTLPSLEFAYFDPFKKEYVVKSTQPQAIDVLEGAPGATLDVAPAAQPNQNPSPKPQLQNYLLRGLKSGDAESGGSWRWVLDLLGALGILITLSAISWEVMRRRKNRTSPSKKSGITRRVGAARWKEFKVEALKTRTELIAAYDQLCMVFYDSMDDVYPIGARALPRGELKQKLMDEGQITEALWSRITALLEFAETVRYALSAGVVSEAQAKTEFKKWLDEAQKIASEL